PLKTEYPDWAVRGAMGREHRFLSSIYIEPKDEEVTNYRLMQVWNQIQASEIRYREYYLDDAEIVVIGFGTAGRIALSATRYARNQGIKVGLFRPITLSPFPFKEIQNISERAQKILVVEMNSGQMLDDVQRAVKGKIPVEFYGRMGGMVPFPDEILSEIQRINQTDIPLEGDPRLRWMERFAPIINWKN
ncbi:MAG: 3-methyl-2-oxobutanoate dehydrogenase subunit beta, partial [Anaerolineales bacterium]